MSQRLKKTLNAEQQAKLTEFRGQIDALDDKIIDLLIERIGVVSQVGAMKRGVDAAQCPLRPGREADMIRRVAQKFEGTDFSSAAAAAIWRILIGASTAVEGALKISVYAPEKDESLYWMAREYFGGFLPISKQPQIRRVIGDVMDGKASVGIVPNFTHTGEDQWWTTLLQQGQDTPSIFAHVPFVYYDQPNSHSPAGLAIGNITPEATQEDVSIIVLDTEYNVSQHRLQTAFAQVNLQAQWLSIANLSSHSRHHLIELKGFIDKDHAGIKSFLSGLGGAVIHSYFLGSYAVPFTLTFGKQEEKRTVFHAAKPA
jgi:chorismate mutase/prephenate dehydratase